MITKTQLQKEIKEIICLVTGIPEAKLLDEANFVDDLGMESIMAVDMVGEIEEKYKIEIPDEKMGEVDCLLSVVDMVFGLLEKKSS